MNQYSYWLYSEYCNLAICHNTNIFCYHELKRSPNCSWKKIELKLQQPGHYSLVFLCFERHHSPRERDALSRYSMPGASMVLPGEYKAKLSVISNWCKS